MIGNLHLALNHIPFVWILFCMLHLAYSMYRKNGELIIVSLWSYVVTAIVTIGVYVSGWWANELIMDYINADSKNIAGQHQYAGGFAFVLVELLGVLALSGIIYYRKRNQFPNNLLGGLMTMTVITFFYLMWVSHLGGLIRHIELRPDAHTAPSGATFDDWNQNSMPPPLDAPSSR